ncbi:MAG: YajQ family cyclic di-GMP-binding protein [Campylobacterales bacterium]|nr:YajQ family cyclic di-GMP-binding protein [Campylobacterales bacterium]
MMAKEHQFDISAKLDFQELKNAIVQAQKECNTRYDFKGIDKEINFNEGAKTITIISASDNKVDAIYDVLLSKLNKRGIPINSLDEAKMEDSSGGNRKYTYPLIDTIQKDEAKTIQNEIKKLKLKVKSVNQGDEIRVTGKNLDDLQTVMAHLRGLDLKSPLVFDNFR